jgi:hypothetical protein
LSLTINSAKAMRDVCGVDIADLVDLQKLSALYRDLPKIVDCIWVCVQGQHEITDEQFGKSLAGDTLNDALQAFQEELVDFFPDPATRRGLRALLDKSEAIRQQMTAALTDDVNAVDVEKIVDDLRALLTRQLTSQASSASNPGDSRYAN